MFVHKINFLNAFNILPISKKEDAEKNNAGFPKNNVVASPMAANALKSLNFGQQNDYTFLQNINIPSLNLNGNLYVLKNGQKCFVAKKDGPSVIKTFFNVGSMNETSNIRGISHYIEHNLFNGSQNLKPTEFVSNVNNRGGKYNASTGMHWTDYFICSPLHKSDDLERFIGMHADMISRPTFSQEMLEKEKGPVISEIQMMNDNPHSVAFDSTLKMLFSLDKEENNLIGGSVKNIENLTKDDVLKYYNTYYNPKNAITVVIGDVDEKKTMQLLSKHFADFKNENTQERYNEKLVPIQKTVRKDMVSSNARSTMINMAFVGPKNNESSLKTTVMLAALAGYKNARLEAALRKFNTEVGIENIQVSNKPEDNTAIMIATGTSDNNQEEILKVMYETIHNMSYSPLSDKELAVVKKKLKNSFKAQAESNLCLATNLGKEFLNNNNFKNVIDFEKQLDAITAQDIQNEAKKFLDLNKVALCVMHPAEKSKKQISFTGKISNKLDIKTYKTPNNAEMTVLNYPNAQKTVMSLSLESDILPTKTPALLILNKMLDKGTSLMSEEAFADIDDLNDLKSSVSVHPNSIKFKYVAPPENLNIAFDKINKNIFYPALTKENFDKAKAELKNEYLALPKSAEDRAMETLYKGTVREYSLRKIIEDLDKLNYEDVVNYYNAFLSTASLKTLVTCNFSNQQTLNAFYHNLSSIPRMFLPNRPVAPLNMKELNNTKVVFDTENRNQADIVQIFRVKEAGNIKDKAALALLNEILGGNSNSRLFNDLREKQKLAYRVNSSYMQQDNEGILTLRIFTTTDNPNNPKQSENLQKSLNGFAHHIQKLISQDVTQEELDAAKLQLKSRYAFNMESTEGKNELLDIAMDSLYKNNYLDELMKAVDAIKVSDIRKIANHYLTKPSVISVVASEKTFKENEEYLKSLGAIEKF